jgi:hypothetical protein
MACWIGALARQMLHGRAGHAFEPGTASIRQPLRAVEEFDGVGAASRAEGRLAALHAITALDQAMPSQWRFVILAKNKGLHSRASL